MFEKNGQALYFGVGKFNNRTEFKISEKYLFILSILCGTVYI